MFKKALLGRSAAQKSPVGVSGKAMSSSSEIGGASGGGSWIGWKPRNSSFLCAAGPSVVLCVMARSVRAPLVHTRKYKRLGNAGGPSNVSVQVQAAARRVMVHTQEGFQNALVRLDSHLQL